MRCPLISSPWLVLPYYPHPAASVLELVKYRAACDFYREQLEQLVEPALRVSNPFLTESSSISSRKSLGGGRKSFGGGNSDASDALAERVRAEEKAFRLCRDVVIGISDHDVEDAHGTERWIGKYWSGPDDAKFNVAFEKEYLKVKDERDELLKQVNELQASHADTSLMGRVEEHSFGALSQSYDETGPATRGRKNRRTSMGGRMSIGGAGAGAGDVSSKQWADKKACEKEVRNGARRREGWREGRVARARWRRRYLPLPLPPLHASVSKHSDSHPSAMFAPKVAAEKLKTEAAQQELVTTRKAVADIKCEILHAKLQANDASTKERKEREDLERQLASCKAALDTAEALAKEKREEAQETNSTASELTAQVEELKLANVRSCAPPTR